MPIKNFAVGSLLIPIPLYFVPQARDRLANLTLGRVDVIEVLTGREQSLHHEGGFHEITTVVVFAEKRDGFAGFTIQEMGPDAVKPICFLQESNDEEHPLCNLGARGE